MNRNPQTTIANIRSALSSANTKNVPKLNESLQNSSPYSHGVSFVTETILN